MSQPLQIVFVLGTTFLGVGSRPPFSLSTTGQDIRSTAYFCPKCGEIWARAIIEGKSWEILHYTCAKHKAIGAWDYPGSLWSSWNKELNAAFPEELLRRELLLHIKHYDTFRVMYE